MRAHKSKRRNNHSMPLASYSSDARNRMVPLTLRRLHG
jgi:hypothetical protein